MIIYFSSGVQYYPRLLAIFGCAACMKAHLYVQAGSFSTQTQITVPKSWHKSPGWGHTEPIISVFGTLLFCSCNIVQVQVARFNDSVAEEEKMCLSQRKLSTNLQTEQKVEIYSDHTNKLCLPRVVLYYFTLQGDLAADGTFPQHFGVVCYVDRKKKTEKGWERPSCSILR